MSEWLQIVATGFVGAFTAVITFRFVYLIFYRRNIRRMYNQAFLEDPTFATFVWRKKAADPTYAPWLD